MPYFENLIVLTFLKSFFTPYLSLLSFGRWLHILPVSAVFQKGSSHPASLCCLPEGVFTSCQSLLHSGKALCPLSVSAVFWKGSSRPASLCYLPEGVFTFCQPLLSSRRDLQIKVKSPNLNFTKFS